MYSFIAALPSKNLVQAMSNLSDSYSSSVYNTVASFHSPWFKSGETNRYAKSHESRVLREPPRISKPAGLDSLEVDPYIHDRLGTDVRSIRILKILPQSDISSEIGTDCVQCELIAKNLDSCDVKYIALSYTWGVPIFDFPIVILNKQEESVESIGESRKWNSKALQVTAHLYAALVRLRHPTEVRYVWVDQLCINQCDLAEKSRQITFMADIYRKASMTVIWLGEEDQDREIIAELDHGFQSAPYKSREDDLILAQKLADPSSASGKKRRQAILHLLNRTWFSRAWIYQEAVFSPHATFKYGSLEIPLERVQRIVGSICTLEYATGGYARSMIMSTVGYDTLFLIVHGRGCEDPECKRDGLMRSNFLGFLLQVLHQFEATDPRDLIYAFLSFSPEHSYPKIIPDYSKSVEAVWLDAARCIIKSTASLDIFAATGGHDPQTQDLPSWVPNWSTPFPHSRPIYAPDFETSFNAANSNLHTWVEPSNPSTLAVKGFIIGSITHFTPLNFAMAYYRDSTQTFLNLDPHLSAIKKFISFQPEHLKRAFQARYPNLQAALMRTLLADGAFGHEQPLPYDMDAIMDAFANEKEIEELEDKYREGWADGVDKRTVAERRRAEILERVRDWCLVVQEKKVFLSDGGYLGLVPKSAGCGDLVCVLFGSKVPCVLRKVEGPVDEYLVVGQCYLNGWMYGKAPAGEVWGEGRERTFVLV